jgi:hypothetical protein
MYKRKFSSKHWTDIHQEKGMSRPFNISTFIYHNGISSSLQGRKNKNSSVLKTSAVKCAVTLVQGAEKRLRLIVS